MESGDSVDRLLEELDEYYPNSRKKRRPLNPKAKLPKVKEVSWDSKPQVKKLPNGNVVELFSVGDLSLALGGKPIVTIRLWERKGYIPSAPYRSKSVIVKGVKKPGNRMYSRAIIEATVAAFEARGLLNAPRIDWDRYSDFSIDLMETWTKIHNQEVN